MESPDEPTARPAGGTAIIIEPRRHAALPFVIDNVAGCVPAAWRVVVFHGLDNGGFARGAIAQSPHRARISAVELPAANLTIPMYNAVFGARAFYDLIPTDRFLVFQTDSMMFPEHAAGLPDFLDYDYVGAPWEACNGGGVGNGGFSLRRKGPALAALARCAYNVQSNEDGFFAAASPKKPPAELAGAFSFEAIYSPKSIGCHGPWKYIPHDLLYGTYPALQELAALQRVVDGPAPSSADTLSPGRAGFDAAAAEVGADVAMLLAMGARGSAGARCAGRGAGAVAYGLGAPLVDGPAPLLVCDRAPAAADVTPLTDKIIIMGPPRQGLGAALGAALAALPEWRPVQVTVGLSSCSLVVLTRLP